MLGVQQFICSVQAIELHLPTWSPATGRVSFEKVGFLVLPSAATGKGRILNADC